MAPPCPIRGMSSYPPFNSLSQYFQQQELNIKDVIHVLLTLKTQDM